MLPPSDQMVKTPLEKEPETFSNFSAVGLLLPSQPIQIRRPPTENLGLSKGSGGDMFGVVCFVKHCFVLSVCSWKPGFFFFFFYVTSLSLKS